MSEKVATPATAATVNVPPKVAVAPDGSVPKAIVTLSVFDESTTPFAS